MARFLCYYEKEKFLHVTNMMRFSQNSQTVRIFSMLLGVDAYLNLNKKIFLDRHSLE